MSDKSGIEWMRGAPCSTADPNAFFPEMGGDSRAARKICGRCDVRAECLTYALDNNERFGIWGGLSERRRRQLSRPNLERKTA